MEMIKKKELYFKMVRTNAIIIKSYFIHTHETIYVIYINSHNTS